MKVFVFCLFTFFSTLLMAENKSGLLRPMNELFSHQKHNSHFKNLNISCQDCHRFEIKTKEKGPQEKPIAREFLRPQQSICHQCHLEKIELPRNSQCTLCHIQGTKQLRPRSHEIDWKRMHGKMAQFDPDSCTTCHRKNDCSDCHLHRDRMNRRVHPASYKYFHSIEARVSPNSCTTCHQTPSFCIDCHSGRSP